MIPRQRAIIPLPTAQAHGIQNIVADSEEEGNEAEKAMDGDPKTIWHTPWRSEPTGYPHYLQAEFKSPRRLRGFTALPRQDASRNGWICDYAFYASNDAKNWGEPVKRGTFDATKDLKTVLFKAPVTGRFFYIRGPVEFRRAIRVAGGAVIVGGNSRTNERNEPRTPVISPSDAEMIGASSPGRALV